MALSLAPYFSGVIFPVSIPVRDFLEAAARTIEQRMRFGTAFDRTRFAPAGSIRHLVLGDDLQQSSHELVLLFAAAGLRDGDTELPH